MRTSLGAGRRTAAVVVCVAALVAGAAACGTTQPSPSAAATTATPSQGPLAGLTADQIARKAIADLAAVSSVHVAGSVTEDGHADLLDLTLGPNGCTAAERIPGQGAFAAIVIGNTMWFKTEGQIERQLAGMYPARVRPQIAGKYLQEPNALTDVTQLCGPGQFAGTFGGPLKDLVKGKITTISGQPALQLADKRHSKSAYVTISARPEFLRADVSGQEHLAFTGYNQPVTFVPPPADQTVTPAQLGALATAAAG